MKLAGDKMYVNCNDYTVNLSLCQEVLTEVDEYLSPKACKEDQKSTAQAFIPSVIPQTFFESLICSRCFTGASGRNKTSMTPRRKAGVGQVSTQALTGVGRGGGAVIVFGEDHTTL